MLDFLFPSSAILSSSDDFFWNRDRNPDLGREIHAEQTYVANIKFQKVLRNLGNKPSNNFFSWFQSFLSTRKAVVVTSYSPLGGVILLVMAEHWHIIGGVAKDDAKTSIRTD